MQNIIDGIDHSPYNELIRICEFSATPKATAPKCYLHFHKRWNKPQLHNSFNELDIGVKPSFQNKNFPVRKLIANLKQITQQNFRHPIESKFNYALPISILNQEKRLKNASVDFLKSNNSSSTSKVNHYPIPRSGVEISIRYRPYRTIQKDKDNEAAKDKLNLPSLPHSISHHNERYLYTKIAQNKPNQISIVAAKVAQFTPKPANKIKFQTTLHKQNYRKISPVPNIESVPPIILAHTRNTALLDKKKIRALTLRQRSFDSVELSPWKDDDVI